MSRTIYKYPLPLALNAALAAEMPQGAQILHVGMQRPAEVCIWALVDTEAPKEVRHFRIYGTGHHVDQPGKHLGTILDGPYVWHVFEVEG